MSVRRVVTGHEDGRSKFVSDGPVDAMPLGMGGEAWMVWGRDDTARFPDDGSQPATDALFPPVGGCRVTVLRLASGQSEAFDQFVVEGLADFADADEPGMH